MKKDELLKIIKDNLSELENDGELVLTSSIPDKAAKQLCNKLSPFLINELSPEEITGIRGAINEVINGFGLYNDTEGEIRIGVSKETLDAASKKLKNAI